jgi:hypothetical protein
VPRLRGIMSDLKDWIGNVKLESFCVLRPCFGGGRDILVCLMITNAVSNAKAESKQNEKGNKLFHFSRAAR